MSPFPGGIPARTLASGATLGALCLGIACGGSGDAGLVPRDDGGGGASSGSGSSSGGSIGGSSSGGASSSGGSAGGTSSGPSSGGSSGGSGGGGVPGGDAGAEIDGGAEGGDAEAPGSLDPGLAPGGNFDLSVWELQEPVGSPGSPTTISPAQLQGPNGFHDAYFFTDPTDGSMSFWDPENGVTTANSNYPRSDSGFALSKGS